MVYKPVGADENGLFPTRVMTALKNLFTQKTDADLSYFPKWRANIAYPSGTILINPTGQTVKAPADVAASATYVAANWTPVPDVPLGGTALQVLTKNTATDGDMAWASIPDQAFANTFVDVALGSGSGTTTQQSVGASFTKVNLPTVVSDPGNNYSTSDVLYVVPSTGLYLCQARLRVVDNSTAGSQVSLGIHTSAIDGAFFQWNLLPTQASSAQARNAFPYSRIAKFTAGDRLFLYSYCVPTTGISVAGMQIIRIA